MGAVCHISGEILGVLFNVIDRGPTLKQDSCQRSNLGQTKKNLFRKCPLQYVVLTSFQQGCSATSGVASIA